jgi:hypothetical protein
MVADTSALAAPVAAAPDAPVASLPAPESAPVAPTVEPAVAAVPINQAEHQAAPADDWLPGTDWLH